MKKNILLFFFATLMVSAFAQTTQRLSPDFTARTIDHDSVTLSDILINQQKYVALEFFFNENIQCMETSPLVTEAYQNLGSNQTDVIFISINVGNDSIECRNYMDSLSLQTPVIVGTNGGDEIAAAYDIQSYPTLILISPSIPDTLIALDSILTDTVINEIDTTLVDYYYYEYNIVENDIWPITSANDIISVLTSYSGITKIIDPFEKREYTFNLYPNPSNGIINIEASKISGLLDFQIINIAGQTIYSDKIYIPEQQNTELNLSWLKKGIYFLKIQNEENNSVKKLIIQ